MKISLMLLMALIPALIIWSVIIYVVYLLIDYSTLVDHSFRLG